MFALKVRSHRGQEDKEERQVRGEADTRHDQLPALLHRHSVPVHELASRAERNLKTASSAKCVNLHAQASSASRGPLVHS